MRRGTLVSPLWRTRLQPRRALSAAIRFQRATAEIDPRWGEQRSPDDNPWPCRSSCVCRVDRSSLSSLSSARCSVHQVLTGDMTRNTGGVPTHQS